MVSRVFLSRKANLFALFALQRSSSFIGAFSPLPLYQAKHSFSSTTTSLGMSKKVLVPISDGSEEIETTCIQDTLVRCGAAVTVASVKPDGDLVCKMSRGIKVMADMTIEEAAKEDYDLVVLPGGMPGATHLKESEILDAILKKQQEKGSKYAAICAAPAVVLAAKGMVGEGITCYPAPGFREVLSNPSDERVVVTGQVTTSQGPGTAIEFALELGKQLFGEEVSEKIRKEMLIK